MTNINASEFSHREKLNWKKNLIDWEVVTYTSFH